MLTVNLFDDCFRHSICSIGWQTPEHIRYVRDQMEFDGITLFTDGYINSPVVEQVKSRYKVGWLHEPQCLHPENYQVVDPDGFDLVLTYFKPLLQLSTMSQEAYPFRFAPYGGCWINKEDWGLRPKTKLVSMLYGDKMTTEGHRMRHQIAEVVAPLEIVDFYGFLGEPVDYSPATKLKVLGDYAFSIVCEACYQENLFTEILLDCFAVGTIPIFWGCPNIGEFFNDMGILTFKTAAQVEELLSWLSLGLYGRFVLAAIDNLRRVRDYAITEDWLYQNILRELE